MRDVLCELRNIFNYLGRNDLILLIAGMHAPRYHRIIPVLDTDEQERIKDVTHFYKVELTFTIDHLIIR